MERFSIYLTGVATIFIAAFLTSCQQQKSSEATSTPQPTDNAPAAQAAAQIAGTPSGTVMTPEYVATIGRFAYVWGWPLLNNLNRALAVKDIPSPGRLGGVVPVSPPGRISMLSDYISADERYVTCPNQDTVYGAGFQHVDTQPVVVQVPDFGNRFFVYQIADARTNSFGQIRQTVRHEIRLLRYCRSQLEGYDPLRHYGSFALCNRSRRYLSSHLSGRHSRGQSGDSTAAEPGGRLPAFRLRRQNEDDGLEEHAILPRSTIHRW
jgi:hypothetical protein